MDRIKKAVEEQQRMCINCNCVLENGEGTAYGNGEICENCLENEFSYCDHCGEVIHNDEAYEIINGDFLCRDCTEEFTNICDHCGGRVYTNDTVSDDDIIVCSECYDEHYHRCEDCNRIIHENDVNWYNNLPYCDNCYDEIESDDEIEDYNYKPSPVFYGDGNRFFGVELEVDYGGKYGENALEIKDIANYRKEHIYIKSDGSLDEGFEIVSHPMTLDYHMNEMDWESVMHKAISLGYRSHQTSTCGLHIHVNRNAFGDNQSEQEEAISKILFFIEKNWNEIFQFSRRSSYNMNRWSARFGFEKTAKEILDKAKSGGNGRYVAVNLNNYHTIEFRLFRGTLKYNTFIATLQMVNKICDVALSMSEREIDEMSWSSFVSSVEEPELIQYLKERKLYINEDVTTEEEI